jgi:hypothetical protein
MHFHERDESGWRIYVGALEAPGGGYTAALAIERAPGPVRPTACGPHDSFRDDSLACGHRWTTPEDAMGYALRKGRAWVRAKVGLTAARCATDGSRSR